MQVPISLDRRLAKSELYRSAAYAPNEVARRIETIGVAKTRLSAVLNQGNKFGVQVPLWRVCCFTLVRY